MFGLQTETAFKPMILKDLDLKSPILKGLGVVEDGKCWETVTLGVNGWLWRLAVPPGRARRFLAQF
jgi:hypothetical protein